MVSNLVFGERHERSLEWSRQAFQGWWALFRVSSRLVNCECQPPPSEIPEQPASWQCQGTLLGWWHLLGKNYSVASTGLSDHTAFGHSWKTVHQTPGNGIYEAQTKAHLKAPISSGPLLKFELYTWKVRSSMHYTI